MHIFTETITSATKGGRSPGNDDEVSTFNLTAQFSKYFAGRLGRSESLYL